MGTHLFSFGVAGYSTDVTAGRPVTKTVARVEEAMTDQCRRPKGSSMIKQLHGLGVRSEYAYIGGFASIVASYLSYFASRAKKGDDKAQSDRWGIFIGHWAPTFFALGVALRLEEQDND
jgi:hypothetical protein